MRTYQWWLGQKRRVQKKYTLLLGRYLSPKEAKEWLRRFKGLSHEKKGKSMGGGSKDHDYVR